MRKLVSIAVSAELVLSMAACGKADSSAATAASKSKSSTSSSSTSSNSTSDSTPDGVPDGVKVGDTYTTADGKQHVLVEAGTGNDLPASSPKPTITYDNDFQAITFIDNDICTIILQAVGYDDDYGYYWKMYFKNNTADTTLSASTNETFEKRMTLNGIPAELHWQPKAEPGEERTEVASWDKEGLKIYGVEPQDINTVEIPIDVYNEAEWGVSNRDDPVDDEFVIYPKGAENATEPKHEIQPTDIVLFDNDACSMVICGFYSDPVFGYTAKVYYENKTDERR